MRSLLAAKELEARKSRERQNDREDARFNLTEDACADYVEYIWGYLPGGDVEATLLYKQTRRKL